MSLTDSLKNEEVWEQFRQYKLSRDNMTKREKEFLQSYITNKKYLPLAQTLSFSLPAKRLINKGSSGKKRVIYTFPENEVWVLKLLTWLMYKYDGLLCKSCYSFRRQRTAHDAIRELRRTDGIDSAWVLKLDIHDYFNSMPSQLLVRELADFITDDEKLLSFLTQLFSLDKAMWKNSEVRENRGAMAGTPLSAFCANIYLTDLDRRFELLGVPYFRYSDDILVLAQTRQQAIEYYELIKEHVKAKGLELNEEKFSLSAPGEPWDFLGFGYRSGETDLSQAAVRKMKAKIKRKAAMLYRRKCKKGLSSDECAAELIRIFNKKFYATQEGSELTWCRWYFPVLTTDRSLRELDSYLEQNVRFIFTGRYYKGNYRITYGHIKQLGLRSLVNEFHKYKTQ